MNTPAVERASTLKTAFRICNVNPLTGDDIERYYVDLSAVRKTEAIEGVNTLLDFQEAGEFTTILFTGHRGCGKSTELRRIQSQWEQDYKVVYLEVNEETDINDATYIDLYLIVIKQIEFELRKMKLKLDPQLLKSFEDWFKEVTKEDENSVESSVSITGEASLGADAPFIAKLLVKLLAQIKGSDKQKTTIRQTLKKDISRLKADINLLLADAY
jgi:ABC-type cobalamin/Fe3+-siderophores transport system ATPase subunit